MNLNGRRLIAAILAGAGLFGAAITTHAADDIIVDQFNADTADTELGLWSHWWGGPTYDFSVDPAEDANGDSNSGALKVTVDFDLATYAGDNQFSFLRDFKADPDGFTSVDGTQYTNLVMDVKFDPSSPVRPSGDFGFFEYGIRKADYSQDYFGNATISSSSNGWFHLVAPIPVTHEGIESIAGITFKMWTGDTAGMTGTTTFWVDNIKLIASTNVAPTPPPTLTIGKADPGLHLLASADAAQYQRQNIRTFSPEYSWVDAGGPVTYSFTVKDFPDTNYTGFQMHMFLVPGDAVANSETAPDWNEPNVIFFQLSNNSDGSGTATFHYKINQANGNGMYFNSDATAGPVGSLASISDSKITGKWSLTFSNNTDVTITTPSGSSTNFAFPADAVASFANPLYVYFGTQPNSLANIGQGVTLSQVAISGVNTPIAENFTGVSPNEGDPLQLDPTIWEVVADNKPGVILTTPDSAWTIKWTVPATGFELQTSPSLGSPTWTTVTATPAQVGTQKIVNITADTAPGKTAFFRLVKPVQDPPEQP